MKKWKAILFDMDGTLFDTEQLSRIAWFETGKKYNLPITEQFILDLIGRTHKGAEEVYKKYMPEGWPKEEAYRYHEEYAMEYKKEHGPLPKTDLKKLLTSLKDKGYKIALATSGRMENVDFNLHHENIMEYFDVIVTGAMVEHGKPEPDIYIETARKLGIEPSLCLVVEDSINGVLSGSRANMDVVMIPDMIEPDEAFEKYYTYKLDSLIQIDRIL